MITLQDINPKVLAHGCSESIYCTLDPLTSTPCPFYGKKCEEVTSKDWENYLAKPEEHKNTSILDDLNPITLTWECKSLSICPAIAREIACPFINKACHTIIVEDWEKVLNGNTIQMHTEPGKEEHN